MRRFKKLTEWRQSALFIAMNRFQVPKENEKAFEERWLNREVHLTREQGFVEFHLLRGPELAEYTLYASHTVWATEGDFIAWTKSQAFRDAHRDAGQSKSLYIGAPAFEGFSVIQTVTADGDGDKRRRA